MKDRSLSLKLVLHAHTMNKVTGEDLACTDEVKVYEDEGEEDEQVTSSENLTEDKVGLVIESEGQVS